jgi:hypothetical protein
VGFARDARRLGVAIRRIVLVQQTRQRAIEAGDARLRNGFHQYETESGLRWTNGDATIPADLFAGVNGRCVLMVDVACATRYVDDSEHRRAA